MKKCSDCNEVKTVLDFYKRKKSKDGLRGICKECSKKYLSPKKDAERKKAWYEKNEGLFIGKRTN